MRKAVAQFIRWLLPREERRAPQFAAQIYARQRRRGFPFMRFQPGLESEYRDSSINVNVMRLRITLTFGALAILGFIALDYTLGLSLEPGGAVAILVLVTSPALVIPGLMTFSERMRPYVHDTIFLATLVMGLSLIVVIFLGKMANRWFPWESILLVTFYTYSIGLLFWNALFCGALFWLGYVGGALWLGVPPPTLLIYDAYYFFIANAIGVTGRYLFEYQDRIGFLMQCELTYHAQHDSLTGLLNRRAFRRTAASIWAQAGREQKTVGLVMLDLDGFKQLNDKLGHLAGDAILIAASRLLREQVRRPLDACGRFGGDEFVAVWYDVEQSWFEATVQRLHRALNETPVREAKISGIKASIGAVLLQPQSGDSFNYAIREADVCLYDAKRDGGNRIASGIVPHSALVVRRGNTITRIRR